MRSKIESPHPRTPANLRGAPVPKQSNTSLWKIRQPCSADWDKMRGDDKHRFCDHCQKFVHNVSAMTRTEREAFANPANMRECVFYCRRTDGEVADLSFLASLRRWFPFLRLAGWSALVALLPVALTGCMMGKRCEPPRSVTPRSSQTTNQTSSIQSPR